MPHWRWILRELLSRIWFRAAMIAFLSVLLALSAAALAPIMPYDLSIKIGAKATDNILTILASSMLAVTTFSLTAMVTAFSGAAQLGTPRATELLIEDKTAQNALSIFLGGFLFAIVGVIALSTGLYGEQGRAILLIGTILMIAWIAVTLLRWIGRLAYFGRLGDTIARVERKSRDQLEAYPGARIFSGRAAIAMPPDAIAVPAEGAGYIAHVDRQSLAGLATEAGVELVLCAPPGQFVRKGSPLAWSRPPATGLDHEKVRARFTVHRSRDLDQDPRFGMVVLSEIASRALSPAVNDPGSAIAVLVSAQRVLERFLDAPSAPAPYPGLLDHPLSLEEMVEDLVLPIARDGAHLVEVGIQLQKLLGGLAETFPGAAGAMARLASDARGRAMDALSAKTDRERLDRAHGAAFPSEVLRAGPSVS
ncbi:DUF2254 domain-containing protein [Sphingomicrobium nitratireducens]|uniref:DUF2254 domain-containing protein n=1 Tax=Sphingomicrobium nitratireducens TaxID=2964666 RepID=UPI00223EEBDF|nr:DUF2254 domain-containing protein [Sphingomicrobium nitratireducens]